MQEDLDFEKFLKEAEACSLDPDPVVRSLSGEVIDPHDVACACPSTVRPKPLTVEDMFSAITPAQRNRVSATQNLTTRFIVEYLEPRQKRGKQFHCLSHSYLMKRFELSKSQVVELLRFMRNKQLIEIVYPAMSDLKRAPIYKVNDRYVQHELRCASCNHYFSEVLETARDRLEQRDA